MVTVDSCHNVLRFTYNATARKRQVYLSLHDNVFQLLENIYKT